MTITMCYSLGRSHISGISVTHEAQPSRGNAVGECRLCDTPDYAQFGHPGAAAGARVRRRQRGTPNAVTAVMQPEHLLDVSRQARR